MKRFLFDVFTYGLIVTTAIWFVGKFADTNPYLLTILTLCVIAGLTILIKDVKKRLGWNARARLDQNFTLDQNGVLSAGDSPKSRIARIIRAYRKPLIQAMYRRGMSLTDEQLRLIGQISENANQELRDRIAHMDQAGHQPSQETNAEQ